MWVPWRAGATSREQKIRRARKQASRRVKAKGGPTRGRVKDREASARALKARRGELLKQLRKGKITPKEYRRELAAAERKHR